MLRVGAVAGSQSNLRPDAHFVRGLLASFDASTGFCIFALDMSLIVAIAPIIIATDISEQG